MKIAILTLPLHTNYGGILQAYALQTTLECMGHTVVVLDSDKHPNIRPWYLRPLVWGYYAILKYVKHRNVEIFPEKKMMKGYQEYLITSQNTQKFVDNHINRRTYKSLSEIKPNEFDVIVVGSDQVWRVKYFFGKCIKNAYLDFTKGWNIKRIAYAASFGTDEWEYSPTQTEECKRAISLFDAVSVREDAGVALCKKYFGIDAKHVLDPTMLLSKEDYESLVDDTNSKPSEGDLLTYIIDETPEKVAIVDKISRIKGLKPYRVNSNFENLSADVNERIQPPVEQWLRGFMEAKFVVTDSFHACVFSIIFSKPFVVIGNEQRGVSRFKSLLGMFGLEDHLVLQRKLDMNKDYMSSPSVYEILNQKKEESVKFLYDQLV